MIDTRTEQPLRVTPADDLPYIMVAVSQLPAVKACLDRSQVEYWVDSGAISIGGEPMMTFINLKRGTAPESIQAILDRAE